MSSVERTNRFLVVGLTMLFVLGTLGGLILVKLPAAQGAPPVGPGDWIVDSTEVFDGGVWPGGVIYLDGNLTIKDGGNLTLQNALVLQLNCTYGNEFHVEVQDGGILRLHSGTVVTVDDPNFNMGFYVQDGARLEVTGNSIIEEVGLQQSSIQDSGIYINSDRVKFDQAEIRNTASGILVDGVSPTIRNSDIHDNDFGIVVTGEEAKPIIVSNDIYNHQNPAGWVGGVFVVEDAEPSLSLNTIHDNQWGIMVHHAKAIIDDNDIYDNNFMSNGIGVFGVNEANITVTNNTFDGNTAGVGISNFCTGYIAENEFMNHQVNGAGVSIGDTSDPLITDNDFHHNNLAIYVGHGSSPEISHNVLEDNENGIHVERDFSLVHNNTISGVDVAVNTQQGITVTGYSDAIVRDNTITNIENGNGLRVDDYSTALVQGNTINDCQWQGIDINDFAKPTLMDNDVTGCRGGIRVSQYAEAMIFGGSIEATEWEGLNVENGASAVIEGVTVDNSQATNNDIAAIRGWNGHSIVKNSTLTGKDVDVIVGDQSQVVMLNTVFDPDLVNFHYSQPRTGDMSSRLRVGWYLDVTVQWQNSAPVPNATIDVVTDGHDQVNQVWTDDDGTITTLAVIEYDRTFVDTWYNYTDHYVNATKNGVHATSVVTMDRDRAITITLDDIADPFLAFVIPTTGEVIGDNTVFVNGTSTDPESGITSVEVTYNGGANWTEAGTIDEWANWDLQLNLSDGDYEIMAHAYNAAGRTAEATIDISVDTVLDLNVTMPMDGLLTNMADLTVNGTAEDGLLLQVNGANVTVENGTFTTNVTLIEGKNTITFNATDLAGNNLAFNRTVTLDSIAPVVNITVPGPEAHHYSTSSNITIEGTLNEVSTVTMNGVDVTVDDLAFSHELVNLSDGDQDISLVATDPAGNQVSLELQVTVDTVAPDLDVVTPVNGTITNVNFTILNGTTDADMLTVNDENETLDNGTFTRNVTLVEGLNTFVFVAKDLAGNQVSNTIEITLDTEAPFLTVLFPIEDLITTESPIEVRGGTEPGANITVNGLALEVDGRGSFSGAIPVTEDTTEVTIIATDAAGNEARVVRAITYDGTMPTITFSGPKNGSMVVGDHVYVKGVVSEADAVVTVNGKEVEVGSEGNFSVKVELFEGKNTIVIRATDKGGNVFEERIEVTRERAADLTWASIGLLFTFLGVFFGLVGGYAWGKFNASRERPRRKQLGSFEQQVKATREKEEPSRPPKPTTKVKDEPEATEFEDIETERPPKDGLPKMPEPEPKPAPKPKTAPKTAPKKEVPEAGPPKGPEPKPEPKEEPKPEPKEEPKPEPKEEPKPKPEPKEEKRPPKKEDKVDDDLKDILSRLDI